jgi:6-pyruvoyltetrahydropterin/6-carboxytetrahydropterin synthase
MTWTIDKQFSFCYGHRVWVQKLEAEYTENGDCSCKCRHLHGHEGLAHVFLEAEQLNKQAMVTDFKHLGWLKTFIDSNLDHKFIIDKDDPYFETMVSKPFFDAGSEITANKLYFLKAMCQPVYVPGTSIIAGHVIDMKNSGIPEGTPEYEVFEGYFIVDFVPTSENLSKWLYDVVNFKMKKLGVKTSRVDWFETPKSRSTYYGK